ncbi:PaaI family thioesterase [Amylibacter sp. IMCC11727]|uniref:PaaI family thioesterase n=1 Tax=Amylibacter sp. IMCC11727 TaxID=3039851 RepID=UPI00244E482B|nr:PaaI family thioesterase [Amylibacter sp. IMCC11727]WGI22718.1 PaaI family thioesterase [Amylibacter sp. IMCC11727]
MKQPEPLQIVKERRDGALKALVDSVPYIEFMGVSFDRRGDELTAVMAFDPKIIGNPVLPAIHGGATASFLEMAALIELAWQRAWGALEEEKTDVEAVKAAGYLRLPKTIDFTVDYLRSGLPRDCYARARVNRSGRRYASVHVEAWQDNREKLYAQATGHFLMPRLDVDG